MKAFVRSICELIGQNETFVMATVVESSGSTPRSSGAKMVVRGDGSILGTVGGGLVEARACQDGLTMLSAGDGTASLTFVDMTQELAANSDMICGGGLSVLLEVIEPDGPCAVAYLEVNELLRRGIRSSLVSTFEGVTSLCGVEYQVLRDEADGDTPVFEKNSNGIRISEPFIPPASLYIFGAGHVSLFTARTAAMIGFRTVVLDDREDFANTERFPEADEVVVLPGFAGCCDALCMDENSYVIIVTRGHMHDRTVLAEALRTKARYVGMIGSKKKRDKIYESLLADGFTQQDIDRCHCPIGLTIGAQTPEEIAVSICGELIQVRSGAA
ncbi:XdhC/CoxI family protein [uncultured Pseudodesulfovibrio sp.]|uniref:XdhC family protein n=1 Tax=uncultured Pseudodesulfovibrio sp. TaxID=2035858 RepID=UPI0029C920EC|nr:XdhC/CoxI family protein [uncultured Pseudodesulfovibrio sp.]